MNEERQLDPDMSPSEMISSLISQAEQSGEVEPLGKSLETVQKQLEVMFEKLMGGTGQLTSAVVQNRMQMDLLRMTVGILVRIIT